MKGFHRFGVYLRRLVDRKLKRRLEVTQLGLWLTRLPALTNGNSQCLNSHREETFPQRLEIINFSTRLTPLSSHQVPLGVFSLAFCSLCLSSSSSRFLLILSSSWEKAPQNFLEQISALLVSKKALMMRPNESFVMAIWCSFMFLLQTASRKRAVNGKSFSNLLHIIAHRSQLAYQF